MMKILLTTMFFMLTATVSVFAQEENLHYTLAKEYFAKGNYDLAMDSYKKVLAASPENYEAYSALGDIYRMQGNPAQAELHYKNALKYGANTVTVQTKLADLYEMTGRLDEALKSYREVLAVSDESQKAAINAKIDNLLARNKQQTQTQQQTPVASAKPAVKAAATPAAVSNKPFVPSNAAKQSLDSAVFYYQSGIRNSNNDNLNKALTFISKALKESPGYPAAYYYAGLIRRKFNENEKARINFERAVNDPEWGYNAHFYLGRIYGDAKQYQRAIDNLEIYILKTDYAQGKIEAQNLINAYKKALDAQKAANPPIDIKKVANKEMEEELSMLPPQVPLKEIELRIGQNLSMAIVDSITSEGMDLLAAVRLFNAKEYDNAIEAFRKVIEKYPGKPAAGMAVYNIGVILFQLHKWDESNREFANYMSRYPKGSMFENAMFLSGVTLREQMKNNESQKVFQDYITKYRNGKWTGKAYEYLGDIYNDLDKSSNTIDAYKQADAIGKNTEDKIHARFKLAEVYRKLGNGAQAEKGFLSVISLAEEAKSTTRLADSYYRLADYYYQNKKWTNAGNIYVKTTRTFPEHPDTPWGLYQIANTLYHTNKYKEAVDAYDYLRTNYPDAYWAKEAEFRRNDAAWKYQYKQGN